MNFITKKWASRAFTLTELMVVIAIVTILAALLLPALNRAKELARQTICVKNVAAFNMAWTVYAMDNEDRLVRNVPSTVVNRHLQWLHGDYRLGSPDWANHTNEAFIRTNQLWNYTGPVMNIYKCPSDRTKNLHGNKKLPWLRSIGLSQYMGGQRTKTQVLKPYLTLEEIKSPSMRITFLNQRPDTYENAYFVLGRNLMSTNLMAWYEFPARFHGKTTPVGFADGRVEIKKWQTEWPKEEEKFISRSVDISLGNPDIIWMHQRAIDLE